MRILQKHLYFRIAFFDLLAYSPLSGCYFVPNSFLTLCTLLTPLLLCFVTSRMVQPFFNVMFSRSSSCLGKCPKAKRRTGGKGACRQGWLEIRTGKWECRVFWSKSLSWISVEIESENGSRDLSDRPPRPARLL